MIVMKFGGSSLESAEAVLRVCRIVGSQIHRQPVVVVSAVANTTNLLLSAAEQASLGRGYSARKLLSEVQDLHFSIAGDLIRGTHLEMLDQMQTMFRDIHCILHEMTDEGRILTPALSDRIAGFGERLSCLLVATVFAQRNLPCTHVDAREFILTDDHHGSATPRYWETYAKLSRSFPCSRNRHAVVMGGFIGATSSGAPTTLGRGGSDLTASLVGAGLNAEEIQIWTDVDGLLTCDPRVSPIGYRCRSVSYEEANAMAAAGAKVLHADTVAPAVRQRIPIVIRNSRHPEIEGTRVSSTATACTNPVKGIALTEHLLLLEMRAKEVAIGPQFIRILRDFCKRKNVTPALLSEREGRVYLGVHSAASLDSLESEMAGCVAASLQTNMAIITLVGDGIGSNPLVTERVIAILLSGCDKGTRVNLVSDERANVQLMLAVPQKNARRAYEMLHRELFQSVDPAAFAPIYIPEETQKRDPVVSFNFKKNAIFSTYRFGKRSQFSH